MPEIDPRFCPLCATALEERAIDGAARKACPACEFVHYADPKLAVGVLVENAAGELLYTQRNHEPKMGEWAFPSGFIDRGEVVEEAAVREVREETGAEAELRELLGVFSRRDDAVVFIAYRAVAVGGTLAAGPEAQAVRYFPADALPAPVFPNDAAVLDAWRRVRGQNERASP